MAATGTQPVDHRISGGGGVARNSTTMTWAVDCGSVCSRGLLQPPLCTAPLAWIVTSPRFLGGDQAVDADDALVGGSRGRG